MKELIDGARWDGTLKALKTTFATDALDEVSELIGGGSTSKMFKLKVGTKYYVLRLMGLDQPLKERRIQAECAQYGARLNIAPHCYYVDVTDGILIMDFVTCATLTKDIILDKMPKLLNKLHYSEKISPPFYEIFTYMTDFIEKISKITPDQRIINYYQAIIEVMSILADHRQIASCHNDLNSENVLYDGKQLYLIDFEAAGLEDPYFDLATVCQQNCFDQHEELAFLENYLGRKPHEKEIAKLALMKQVSYCFHALHFFQHAYNANMMTFNDNVPSFKQWYEGRKEGKYSYETTNDLMRYAMVVLNQSLEDMSMLSFLQAKRILIDRDFSKALPGIDRN